MTMLNMRFVSIRQGCCQGPRGVPTLLISWATMEEQSSSHRALEASAHRRPRDIPRRESEEEELYMEAQVDIFNTVVVLSDRMDWR